VAEEEVGVVVLGGCGCAGWLVVLRGWGCAGWVGLCWVGVVVLSMS